MTINNPFGYFYSLSDINIEKALEAHGYRECKTSGSRHNTYLVRCEQDKSYKYTNAKPGTARTCMRQAQPDPQTAMLLSQSIAHFGYSDSEIATLYAKYTLVAQQHKADYEQQFEGKTRPWYADEHFVPLAFERYLEGVKLGQYEYRPNEIYINGGKGSLSFYYNGTPYRLDGVSASYPTFLDQDGHWRKAPQHVIQAFEAAYQQGRFAPIGYTKMTESGFDVYLSSCT